MPFVFHLILLGKRQPLVNVDVEVAVYLFGARAIGPGLLWPSGRVTRCAQEGADSTQDCILLTIAAILHFFAVMRSLTVILLFAIATACRTNETPEQQVKDAEITANMKSKLAAELGASTVTNISVNVTNEVITLAGTVHDSAEKSRAVAIAQAVPGVARVNDNLQFPAAPGTKP